MNSHSLDQLKHTPLYEWYRDEKIKLMDFGGWAMPIQFSGILNEHLTVRSHAGLFDVSHMGELFVEGPEAGKWLNGLVTNDLTKVKQHQAQYNVVCNNGGGTLDDLIITKLDDEKFFITPNASNADKIYRWLEQHREEGVILRNASSDYGLLALQGPKAEEILQRLTEYSLSNLAPFYCEPAVELKSGIQLLVSRTGYTGEDGFELYCSSKDTVQLWKELLEAGKDEGLIPCGLGARDTLRLEMGYPLYGQELNEHISPLEAGIGFAVKTKNKEADYIGKDVLSMQRTEGVTRKVCGFLMDDKGIPRTGYPVYNKEGRKIGEVTSGTKSPSLNQVIGMALVETMYAKEEEPVLIGVRNKRLKGHVVKKPFYSHSSD